MSDGSTQKSGTSRGVKIALALSLAVNLMIIGLAAGVYSQVQSSGGGVRFSDAGGAYTRALLPEDRRSIGREMNERFRPAQQDRILSRREYERMLTVLGAEQFDRATAEEILRAQAVTAEERRQAAEQLLLDRLEAMSAEERAAFAKRLTEGLKRPAKGSGRP